jgi:DNA-binding CsgD family transcriptional regulator
LLTGGRAWFDLQVATLVASSTEYEDLFRAVFEASRNAMLICDDARKITDANAAAEALTGYPVSRLRGMHLDDLYLPELRGDIPAIWERGLAAGTLAGNRPLLLAGGGTVPIHFCATTVAPHLHLIVYLPTAESSHSVSIHTTGEVAPPTRRQREVITQLALGLTTKEIADQLVLSEDTVRTHVRNAIALTHSRNRAHLVAQALQRGWIVNSG